jgi:hypothetical protein
MRLLFASIKCYLAPSSGAALCTRELRAVRYDMFDLVGGLSVFLAMETVFARPPARRRTSLRVASSISSRRGRAGNGGPSA